MSRLRQPRQANRSDLEDKTDSGFAEKHIGPKHGLDAAWARAQVGHSGVVFHGHCPFPWRHLKYGAFCQCSGAGRYSCSVLETWGADICFIKNVARDRHQFSRNWGRALSTTFISSSILFAVVLLASRFLLPAQIPIRLAMFVAAADLFGTSIAGICGQAFVAVDRMKWTASIQVMQSASRLSAAGILAVQHHSPSALQWGEYYFASTSIVAVVALFLVLVKLGAPTFTLSRDSAEAREGLYFSVGQSAQTIYDDIDKAMLARLGTLEATGIYGAAYRLIDVSFTPVWSLLAAAYPNFFRAGLGGVSATLHYARPLLLRALAYATFVSIAVLAGAGIVPHILGPEYRLTVEALRWLAVLPMLKVIHYFLYERAGRFRVSGAANSDSCGRGCIQFSY